MTYRTVSEYRNYSVWAAELCAHMSTHVLCIATGGLQVAAYVVHNPGTSNQSVPIHFALSPCCT